MCVIFKWWNCGIFGDLVSFVRLCDAREGGAAIHPVAVAESTLLKLENIIHIVYMLIHALSSS